MVPIKMLGLLAFLSLAFAIVARARPMPMESLAGYGDSVNQGLNQLLHDGEAAGLPAATHQHPDWSHTQVPRPNSDPLSQLAGYAGGESGTSTSSSPGPASFGGHSGYWVDAEGWHPGNAPFQQPQAGFDGYHAVATHPLYAPAEHNLIDPRHFAGHTGGQIGGSIGFTYGPTSFGGHHPHLTDTGGIVPPDHPLSQAGYYRGNAASTYLSHAPAGHIAIDPRHLVDLHRYQLAAPNFWFQPQPASNPSRVPARSDAFARYQPYSWNAPGDAAPSKPSSKGKRIANVEPQRRVRSGSASEEAHSVTYEDMLDRIAALYDATPANQEIGPILPTLEGDLTKLWPTAKNTVPTGEEGQVRLGRYTPVASSYVRGLVLRRFVSLGPKSYNHEVAAKWIDTDEREWPSLKTGMRNALRKYFRDYEGSKQAARTLKTFWQRSAVLKPCFQPYVLDQHVIVMRRLNSINGWNHQHAPFFFHVAAIPIAHFVSNAVKHLGSASGTTDPKYVSYDLGVLMTSVDTFDHPSTTTSHGQEIPNVL